MSLLQNEDFALYQLRTAYLTHIKDGVGERLINVNSSVLNNPAFRASGWVANPSDLKRTYSPPIPTAITSEYFQAPRSAGLQGQSLGDDEEDTGGLVTGGGSNDTIGPTLNVRRRRRREQMEEDDSSDLSDESDDEVEATQRAVSQIKFQKMPVRTRAGSSPIQGSTVRAGPDLMVTSPSKPTDQAERLRRGSMGQVEAVKQRARRDTTTSSDMSSENELDPSVFKRQPMSATRAAKQSRFLSNRIQEDDREQAEADGRPDPGEETDDTSLSSDFVGSTGSASLLDVTAGPSSPLINLKKVPAAMNGRDSSPKKSKPAIPELQALPPPRPISTMVPVSALSQMLKAKNKKPKNPIERFATLSGKGEAQPLWIKVYCPSSVKAMKPFEMPLRRVTNDGEKVTVAEAIGLALWRYGEEGYEPPIAGDKLNVNWWTLRMVEDEEVDYDFPALTRIRPITDFTLNNNRTARGRSRDKPWDEFALVQATDEQFADNEQQTPEYSEEAAAAEEATQNAQDGVVTTQPPPPPAPVIPIGPNRNPITGPNFGPMAVRKDSTNLLDAPAIPISQAAERIGVVKELTIHFMDNHFQPHVTTISATTDTYIAEVFDQVCKKLNVDKALFVLKVSNTATVAPSDRTVEALGDRLHLDLARRRFIGDGAFGLSGSPGSSSPNAPLLLTTGGTPKKGKKSALALNKQDFIPTLSGNYKRWHVLRKQPMSFVPSHPRILAIDGEYMHIMPAETGGGAGGGVTSKSTLFDAPPKTSTFHFSHVLGCKVYRKHPKAFRIVVWRETESKRYDFEAGSKEEAQEIFREVEKGIDRFAGQGQQGRVG